MGWVGSFLPMTVPAFFGDAFNIFLVMQFIRGIHRDMDEAARIDGCSWYGIFYYIILPMIVPALVTVAVLSFINSWGDFMGSLLYLNTPQKYTVAYALKLFSDTSSTDFGATFAMSVLSMVPILIIFFFFQKNLVEGISIQGIKG
jgi:multiple sugar transport system permease protein